MKIKTGLSIDNIQFFLRTNLFKLHRLFKKTEQVSGIMRIFLPLVLALSFGFVALATPDTAHATVTIKFASNAETPQEQTAEIRELQQVINEVIQSDKFLRKLFRRLNARAPDAVITIIFGDSTEFTKKHASGGTFVPEWKKERDSEGDRVLKSGTLIIDKALLIKLRPGHDYKNFLAEVITHELFHAYEASVDVDSYNEQLARRMGEEVATELGYKHLDETRPKTDTTGGSQAATESGGMPLDENPSTAVQCEECSAAGTIVDSAELTVYLLKEVVLRSLQDIQKALEAVRTSLTDKLLDSTGMSSEEIEELRNNLKKTGKAIGENEKTIEEVEKDIKKAEDKLEKAKSALESCEQSQCSAGEKIASYQGTPGCRFVSGDFEVFDQTLLKRKWVVTVPENGDGAIVITVKDAGIRVEGQIAAGEFTATGTGNVGDRSGVPMRFSGSVRPKKKGKLKLKVTVEVTVDGKLTTKLCTVTVKAVRSGVKV